MAVMKQSRNYRRKFNLAWRFLEDIGQAQKKGCFGVSDWWLAALHNQTYVHNPTNMKRLIEVTYRSIMRRIHPDKIGKHVPAMIPMTDMVTQKIVELKENMMRQMSEHALNQAVKKPGDHMAELRIRLSRSAPSVFTSWHRQGNAAGDVIPPPPTNVAGRNTSFVNPRQYWADYV